ncbi:DUF4864 domain-containing protein [Roseovarius sp. D22-M7]|uniref:DUF4864 domain-containing protein n=1 Tax=Roseovarius sp. D22-M7 TaxID=3127116 RepID=UPI00300F916D
MRHVILSLILMAGLTGGARADETAMRSVISDQIEAFLAEDTERAFKHASPFIQRKFGTPETFGDMVRNGYPMVWQPSDVTFLDLEVIDGTPFQSVRMRGPGGTSWIVDYEMIEVDGEWRINGVRVREAPGLST